MAVKELNQLKELFETFDKPTQNDYSDLIDTLSTTLGVRAIAVPGVGNVWDDFNTSTVLNYEQRELIVVYHNDVIYLFNAALGVYGLTHAPVVQSNFVPIAKNPDSIFGDMNKIVYDIDDSGVVDDSELVNGLTVETAVPVGALFTDTVYNHPTGDGNEHVPSNAAANPGDILTSGAVAGDYIWQAIPPGITSHLALTSIGVKTHAEIDTHINVVETTGIFEVNDYPGNSIRSMEALYQSEYDLIVTPDPTTLYIIVPL